MHKQFLANLFLALSRFFISPYLLSKSIYANPSFFVSNFILADMLFSTKQPATQINMFILSLYVLVRLDLTVKFVMQHNGEIFSYAVVPVILPVSVELLKNELVFSTSVWSRSCFYMCTGKKFY